MPTVHLDSMMREFAPRRHWSLPGRSVGELVQRLEGEAPRLQFRLRDEAGRLRPFIRVFVNGEPVDPGQELGRPLAETDTVDILHSIQGG